MDKDKLKDKDNLQPNNTKDNQYPPHPHPPVPIDGLEYTFESGM